MLIQTLVRTAKIEKYQAPPLVQGKTFRLRTVPAVPSPSTPVGVMQRARYIVQIQHVPSVHLYQSVMGR